MSTLDDIKKRAENATEGPWKDDSDGGLYMNGVGAQFMGGKEAIRNAHFAANARTDVPKLVAALEAVDARLARYAKLYEGDTDEEKTIQTLCWLVRAEIKEALS